MRKTRGFQLLDLMVALALVGLAVTLAGSSWGVWMGQYRLQHGGEILADALATARSLAISEAAPVGLRIHPDTRRFALGAAGLESPHWRPLPAEVRFEANSASPVFHPRGNAAPAGSCWLANGYGRIRVVISPAGRIRWER